MAFYLGDYFDITFHFCKADQELQISAQGAAEKAYLDLEKRVSQVALELRRFRMEEQVKEEGPFTTLKSVEDKLSADLQAVKQGIDSIKNSVNGHGYPSWSPMHQAAPVPMWPTKSQPCSPVSEQRSGPLIRPSMCTRSVTPLPWTRHPPSRSVSPCRTAAAVPAPVPAPMPAAFRAPAPANSPSSSESSAASAPAVLKAWAWLDTGNPFSQTMKTQKQKKIPRGYGSKG